MHKIPTPPPKKGIELNAVIVGTGPQLGTQGITFSPLNSEVSLSVEIFYHSSVPDKRQLVFIQLLSKTCLEKAMP